VCGGRRPDQSDFDVWWAEYQRLAVLIAVTPETDERACDRLFERSFRFERLILDTPSSTAPGVRAKAQFLVRLMEMEKHDGAAAMRDIHDFVLRAT
jgi:hypothetical protein